MPVLDQKIEAELTHNPIPEPPEPPKQYRRMLVALALLVASLIVVAGKNWSFWSDYLFPPDAVSSQNDPSDDSSTEITTGTVPKALPPASSSTSKTKSKSHKTAASPTASNEAGSGQIVTSRAVLPPLQVEVVAGDRRQAVHSGTNSVRVDMQPGSPSVSEPSAVVERTASQATVNASDRVKISPSAAEVIARPVRPNYPLLARQMKVEGAVILQALIGKEGSIQDLRVVSGPEILSSAARQAVTQWHFKPYFQDGQPVETQARITVNFTISTN